MSGFYVEIQGDKIVIDRLEQMGSRAVRARPAMFKISEFLMGVMAATFDSQGRRGGGSWRQDTPEWLQRKIDKGLDPRILHATLALRRSMSEPGAPGQVLEIGDSRVILGSDLPYAEKENIDRPFVKILPRDRMIMRQIVADYISRPMRRR